MKSYSAEELSVSAVILTRDARILFHDFFEDKICYLRFSILCYFFQTQNVSSHYPSPTIPESPRFTLAWSHGFPNDWFLATVSMCELRLEKDQLKTI